MRGWLQIKAAAEYAGVSARTVRTWIKERGLKKARVGGLILIKQEWIDQFLESFADQDIGAEVDRIVNEVMGK